MDIQYVSNAHGAAAYIAAYVSKGETEGLRRDAAENMARMPPDSTHHQMLRRIGTTHLSSRETSMQVCSCFAGQVWGAQDHVPSINLIVNTVQSGGHA